MSISPREVERREQDPKYRADWMEKTEACIYDMAGAAPGDLRLFCIPLGSVDCPYGGTAYIKDWEYTNLWEIGVLPYPNAMMVRKISCLLTVGGEVLPVSSPWYHRTHFDFSINRKTYIDGHLDTIADPKAWLHDFRDKNHGWREAFFKLLHGELQVPLAIEAQQLFTMTLKFDPAFFELGKEYPRVRVYLEGLRYRATI